MVRVGIWILDLHAVVVSRPTLTEPSLTSAATPARRAKNLAKPCLRNPSAAHELLAAIYGWFREGFETADPRDAKALLKSLT
jgi:hypothetical protein